MQEIYLKFFKKNIQTMKAIFYHTQYIPKVHLTCHKQPWWRFIYMSMSASHEEDKQPMESSLDLDTLHVIYLFSFAYFTF